MEIIFGAQVNTFAEESGIIHLSAHGYRTGMLISTALDEIQTNMVKAMGNGKLSSLSLIVVSAGFNSI